MMGRQTTDQARLFCADLKAIGRCGRLAMVDNLKRAGAVSAARMRFLVSCGIPRTTVF